MEMSDAILLLLCHNRPRTCFYIVLLHPVDVFFCFLPLGVLVLISIPTSFDVSCRSALFLFLHDNRIRDNRPREITFFFFLLLFEQNAEFPEEPKTPRFVTLTGRSTEQDFEEGPSRMQRFLPYPVAIYPTMTRSVPLKHEPIFPFNKLMPQCHSIFRLLVRHEEREDRLYARESLRPIRYAKQCFLLLFTYLHKRAWVLQRDNHVYINSEEYNLFVNAL